jgi:hypothetical protein
MKSMGETCAQPFLCGLGPRVAQTPGAMALATQTTSRPATRGISILARSIFKEMLDQGYDKQHVIGLSSELLELVSTEMRTGEFEPAE